VGGTCVYVLVKSLDRYDPEAACTRTHLPTWPGLPQAACRKNGNVLLGDFPSRFPFFPFPCSPRPGASGMKHDLPSTRKPEAENHPEVYQLRHMAVVSLRPPASCIPR